jgi:Domain of unknown function (DUF929)
MADNKRGPGGNQPKPGGNTPKPGVSAKDRSRQQSRPVTAKAATGKKGQGRGGSGQGGGRPPVKTKPGARPKGPSGALMAWGAVGVVIVVIVVLVVVKVTSGSGSPNSSAPVPVTPASASVVQAVTGIPQSVYDKVGVTSASVPVTAPIVLSGQPPLTIGGKSPVMLYYGAEYCPYCAAERWAMTAALSRFGTWSGLEVTASGKGSSAGPEPFPGTNTFSYRNATLTSPYLTFKGIEQYTNIPNPNGAGYTTLQNPTKAEQAAITKYSGPTYVPGATAGSTSFPFVDINNSVLISGASFSPGVLVGQSHAEIANGLSNASNPVTQAIVATANYISAGICASTKNQPTAVCQSSGVQAAAKALKLG